MPIGRMHRISVGLSLYLFRSGSIQVEVGKVHGGVMNHRALRIQQTYSKAIGTNYQFG